MRYLHRYAALALLAVVFFPIQVFAQATSIEGTYQLVSRTLKNGTVLKPPEVMGFQTYTKEYRQFNIISKDSDGTITSRSIVSRYTLTPTEYTETTLFHIFVRGQEIRNLSDRPQRSAVSVDGKRISFKTEQREAVYDGNTFTATSAANVDQWEKVD